MILNLAKRLIRRLRRRPASGTPFGNTPATLQQAAEAERLPLAVWQASTKAAPRLYTHLAAIHLPHLKAHYPAQVQATLTGAEQIMEHRFNLLGSGPYCPVDPDRAARGDYHPIDWYLDPIRGERFPRGVPHKDWQLFEMRPPNADIKLPWELGRCQHWPTLGQAYQLTGDQRFAQEIANQLDDFMEANPVGIGINWTCTMDVAIRAANWALALELVRGTSLLQETFWLRAYEALYAHGRFIANNLENHYEVTSNHYLSNLVGLFYLSTLFRDFAIGRDWDSFCRTALEQEMRVQVLPDGADYESSVPYHRLVTELFLGAARLADQRGEPLSADYRASLQRMVSLLAGVLRPDGLMPQVGDADDGRLHIFTHYSDWNPQDPRHLFAPAARLLEQPHWSSLAGSDGDWEAAWWGFAPPPQPSNPTPPPPNSRLYPDAGLAVMRDAGNYLLVTNGSVGTKGFGNHKHNDLLSFEYHHGGHALIVDPGSFVYTSDFSARNRFRATRWHNTLIIDGVEQNEFKEEWLFRLFEKAQPCHLHFSDTQTHTQYCGSHSGYRRLPAGLEHRRAFRLHKQNGILMLCDDLSGSGRHDLEWNFHCAPGVAASVDGANFKLARQGELYTIRTQAHLRLSIEDGAYSPSYGVTHASQRLVCRAQVDLSEHSRWTFAIGPSVVLDSPETTALIHTTEHELMRELSA